ncbi:MAG: (Fe-S)-binding protein [Chloroflexi bacterium]|nr:(Fe-S)-binding protein [Chloroflexota bacterium]
MDNRSFASESPAREHQTEHENTLRCIRCGACLPVCPTYAESWLESESPRGRVALVKGLIEGTVPMTPNLERLLYICLDCRACQTVCPTGVRPGELVVSGRVDIEQNRKSQPLLRKLLRSAVFDWALDDHRNLETAMVPARLYQLLGVQRMVRTLGLLKIVPRLDILERFLPPLPPRPLRQTLAEITPPRGEQKYRVGFFLGCVMSTVFAEASRATVDILARNGCEVFVPKSIRCCGAPFFTEGERARPKRLARDNIDLFLRQDLDVIVTDCAACGAELKQYQELFAGDPDYGSKAAAFSAKVLDITEFLAHILPDTPPLGSLEKKVTYHEPCHLAHAQSVTAAPRKVLKAIPGLTLVEMKQSNWCCGSAGSYTFSHTDYSMGFLEDKMANAAATGADIIVSGNPGCVLQLLYGLQRSQGTANVLFFSQLLEQSYRLAELVP